jgi:hypothetical protein
LPTALAARVSFCQHLNPLSLPFDNDRIVVFQLWLFGKKNAHQRLDWPKTLVVNLPIGRCPPKGQGFCLVLGIHQ